MRSAAPAQASNGAASRGVAAEHPRAPTERASALHVESVGAGPPLVLLHGWAMHGGLWSPIVAALARRFRVHAVDLPGHGFSAPLEPFTLDRISAAVAAHFDRHERPLGVLGWSLGAIVALAWAHAEPARVARLVLVGATPKFVASPDWPHAMAAETLRRFHDELRVAYRPTLKRFLALQVHGSERGRAALHALRERLFARGEPSAAVLQAGLDVLATADLRARLARIGAPTLVVAGERDALTPPQAAAWLARALPNARLARIAGAAHAPFLSHPSELLAALDAFVDGR
jgi:pimeloyl-[acyl-carrier protein] methyl ester esterase